MNRCLAVDDAGRVLSASDPQASWHEEANLTSLGAGGLTALSCPTTSFCAAGDGSGRMFIYDGAWKASPPSGIGFINDVSCVSARAWQAGGYGTRRERPRRRVTRHGGRGA